MRKDYDEMILKERNGEMITVQETGNRIWKKGRMKWYNKQ